MLKIKIISDQLNYKEGAIALYTGFDKNEWTYYDFPPNPKIEQAVNDFCSNHDVVSIVPSTTIVGNNPPIALLIYTITYRE